MRALAGVLGLGLSESAKLGLALGLMGPWIFDLDAFAHLRLHFSLAALAGAVFLFAARWRVLAFVSAGVGVAGLALLGPIWGPMPAAFASAAPGCRLEPLRVAFANIESSNPRLDETIAALDGLDADLFAAVEISEPFYNRATGFLAGFAHSVGGPRPRDSRIWSRLPIRQAGRGNGEPAFYAGYRGGVIKVGGREIGVGAVHLKRPLIDRQEEMIDQAPSFLSGLPRDRIVLGDFNATPWSHAMARFEALMDVRTAPGLRITWRGSYPNPFFGRGIPAALGNQIDHLLVSRGIGVRDIETFPLPGSVHEGVRATLDIPSAECGPLDIASRARENAQG